MIVDQNAINLREGKYTWIQFNFYALHQVPTVTRVYLSLCGCTKELSSLKTDQSF